MQLTHIPLHKTEQFKDVLNMCISIRKEVFIEEQSVPYTIEQDGKDNISSHLLLYIENIPIATLRMRNTEEGIKLERIAVIKSYRGMGYGKVLVSHAMRIIQEEDKGAIIYVHSQQDASLFYESLGFVPSGETTVEAGIPHVTMVYNM